MWLVLPLAGSLQGWQSGKMCHRPSAVWIVPLASPVPPIAVRGWNWVVVLKVPLSEGGPTGGGSAPQPCNIVLLGPTARGARPVQPHPLAVLSGGTLDLRSQRSGPGSVAEPGRYYVHAQQRASVTQRARHSKATAL